MIIEALLSVLFGVVRLFLSLFNFLPDMPASLADAFDYFLGVLLSVASVITQFKGVSIFLGILVGLFVGERLIDIFLWVWRMIHGEASAD